MKKWTLRCLAGWLGLPALLACGMPPAQAEVSVQIGVQIGSYPRLVRVPGYPVYYSPGAQANLFFYDGVYWLYAEDAWYTATWYNGPWSLVSPVTVPLYVLRVPVRYYPVPPPYFRAWRRDAPPRWEQHWGPEWSRERRGWDHWDRHRMPPPAPLPVYQRPYGGERYPSPQQQRELQERGYRYHPRDPVAREHLAPAVPAPATVPVPRPSSPPPVIEHRRDDLQRPVAPPPDTMPSPHRTPGVPPGAGADRWQERGGGEAGRGPGPAQGHGEGHRQGHGDGHDRGGDHRRP